MRVSEIDPTLRPTHLTRRERQVLVRLLAGDAEKEAAVMLGLSRHTLHMHVKRVYKFFKVETRSRLMALFISRAGRQ